MTDFRISQAIETDPFQNINKQQSGEIGQILNFFLFLHFGMRCILFSVGASAVSKVTSLSWKSIVNSVHLTKLLLFHLGALELNEILFAFKKKYI